MSGLNQRGRTPEQQEAFDRCLLAIGNATPEQLNHWLAGLRRLEVETAREKRLSALTAAATQACEALEAACTHHVRCIDDDATKCRACAWEWQQEQALAALRKALERKP